jgi:rod shape-determining protein MreB and related proteins
MKNRPRTHDKESKGRRMFKLAKWFSTDLEIDLGTANTVVYLAGKGVVVNEPSVIAKDTRNGRIVAVGQDAKAMVGMTPDAITAIRPLQDGAIADFRMTEALLRYVIQKAICRAHVLRPKMVIAVPLGVTEVEKKAVRDSAHSAGASAVALVPEPMAAAVGAGMPVEKPFGNMVVDIGGGTTEVAVISLASIVCSQSAKVAGNAMDEAIIHHIKHKHNLLIGERTAEMIKKSLGSAHPLETETVLDVRGRALFAGVPGMRSVSSAEIRGALAEKVAVIIDAVRVTLEHTPPELAADILDRSIILTGGGSLMHNLDYTIKAATGLSVAVAANPPPGGGGRRRSDHERAAFAPRSAA